MSRETFQHEVIGSYSNLTLKQHRLISNLMYAIKFLKNCAETHDGYTSVREDYWKEFLDLTTDLKSYGDRQPETS